MADSDQARLERHFDNIAETALADLRSLALNGGGMGVFFLGTPIIDALARASTRNAAYWRVFVTEFMPSIDSLHSYEPLADVLYKEFRCPGAHNLSASTRFRFTSGDANRGRHLTEVDGFWYLHAGCFAEDVVAAFKALRERTRSDADLRNKVLTWFDEHPPVAPEPSVGPIGGTEAITARP